ncbi:TPA: hypothetical protein DCL37_08380 [Candidatus Acetothermia bacterium]|nr:hypothetical protein [Candidatus Bipolaricaulota bacterium]HAF71335.1 hypothetical protein [Candidatus Acetothermia bacterium]
MGFTVKEFHDLVRILEQHPEWRAELRRLLLPDEVLALPQLVHELITAQRRSEERLTRLEETVARLAEAQAHAEKRLERLEETVTRLAEAQAHAEKRLERLEETVAQLAEAQARTEKRLERLEETVARLAEAQARTEERLARLEERTDRLEQALERLAEAQARAEVRLERLEETVARLAEAQARTEGQLGELVDTVQQLVVDVGRLKGDALERRYRERAFSYFAPLLRHIHVVPGEELMERLEEAEDQGVLSRQEVEDLLQADLVVRGVRREDGKEVYLVVEVSWGVGPMDVHRARRRSDILSKTGLAALPVVAGRFLSPEARAEAHTLGVWQVIDGHQGRTNPD